MLPAVAPIAASANTTTVQMDDLSGVLVVQTMVNGKGPYHFVLDTGAAITVVTPQLAKELQLETRGTETANGMGQQQVQIQTLDLDSVSVGAATQNQVRAAIIPLPLNLTYQGRYGTIHGIVGATFLRNYAVSLDIAHHHAAFTPASLFNPPANVTPLPLTFEEQVIPVVNASVDGTAGRFEIDSGNNGEIVLAQPFAASHAFAQRYGKGVRAQYEGVGGRTGATRIRLDSLNIGDSTMRAIAANVPQATGGVLQKDQLDGNLGYDVLRRFIATVDYGSAKLYLQPTPDVDAYKPLVGTGLLVDRNADGTFRVIGIVADGPADRKGIRAGETIVAINGRSTAAMSLADYQNAVAPKAGAAVSYTLRSGSRQRDVKLTTVDMLPPRG